jgi:hypothetical protein
VLGRSCSGRIRGRRELAISFAIARVGWSGYHPRLAARRAARVRVAEDEALSSHSVAVARSRSCPSRRARRTATSLGPTSSARCPGEHFGASCTSALEPTFSQPALRR